MHKNRYKSVDTPVSEHPLANWALSPDWITNTDDHSTIEVCAGSDATSVGYELQSGHGFVELIHNMKQALPLETPLLLDLETAGEGVLELKIETLKGSVYGRRFPMNGELTNRTVMVFNLSCLDYLWGHDAEFSDAAKLTVAVSGTGVGSFKLYQARVAKPGQALTLSAMGPELDPDRDLPGYGFRQRRAEVLEPEDPGVLEWMKQCQDVTTPEQQLIGSNEDYALQTFNNALAAMAFIVKDERERAERILDFFANATDRNNTNPRLQNFFYNGEARGFFQNVIRVERDGKVEFIGTSTSDRWMGDIAWLLTAYKHYEKVYQSDRYAEISDLLLSLLKSWYFEDQGGGGFLDHGWRNGDKYLHEGFGHAEGNIDAYAIMRLCGEHEMAEQILVFLDNNLRGVSMPLDLYSWRVLACGPGYETWLDIPDYDLRVRKTLEIDGRKVSGVFHSATDLQNVWLDGIGHIACAYYAVGNHARGNFYANQYDGYLLDRTINGVACKALPYAANKEGGYAWMDPGKGFISVAAWYIYAKNRFNPYTLETYEAPQARNSNAPISLTREALAEVRFGAM